LETSRDELTSEGANRTDPIRVDWPVRSVSSCVLLEVELQGKLRDAGIVDEAVVGRRSSDAAEAAAAQRRSGIAEVRMVDDVEVLSPELQVKTLRQLEVAMQRGIPIHIAGADDRTLYDVPVGEGRVAGIGWIGCESRGNDPSAACGVVAVAQAAVP